MKLSFENERVMAVVAHPDDAELLCAGTLARARDDGAAIAICVLCRGDKGQPPHGVEDLAAMRRQEMRQAASLLKATLMEAEFPDGELYDDTDSRRVVVELMRQFRPTLLLAHAPEDYHPDHQAASRLATAASWFSASAGHVTLSEPLIQPPEVWFLDTIEMIGFDPDFYLDIGNYLELKRQMIRCHRSQLERGDQAGFSPLLELMERQAQARGNQARVGAAECFRGAPIWKRLRAW